MKILIIYSNYQTFKGEINDNNLISIKEKKKVNGKNKFVIVDEKSIEQCLNDFKENVKPFKIIRAEILEKDEKENWKTIKNLLPKKLKIKQENVDTINTTNLDNDIYDILIEKCTINGVIKKSYIKDYVNNIDLYDYNCAYTKDEKKSIKKKLNNIVINMKTEYLIIK